MYKSIKIEGFRQFDNFEIDDLGAVNLFLGPNNTGKSSILEAFYTHACGLNFNNFNKKVINGRRFNPPTGAYDAGNQIRTLFYSTESPPYKFSISAEVDNKGYHSINYNFEPSPELLSMFDPRSEGYFDPSFSSSYTSDTDGELNQLTRLFGILANEINNKFIGSFEIQDHSKEIKIEYKFPRTSIKGKQTQYYSAVLHDILTHRFPETDVIIFSHLKKYGILKEFVKEIKEAFPIIKDIDYIPYSDSNKAPISVITNENKILPLYAFGDGLRRWYYILGNMITFQNAIHCIEEIDSTFHPKSQHKLAPLLLKYSKEYNNQIMLTSHSLEFADAFLSSLYKDKNNELIKEGEDPIRIFTLAKDKNDKLEVWKHTGKEAFEMRSKFGLDFR
ncbi:MAG: AAA family ATPase [Deltaproteobacteria bacterium]|nr:AAA family ATPase [Deltaproteobacteria bacterium]